MNEEKVENFRRATNFTERENDILVNLVSKFKNIIECKKTDAVCNRDKDIAWTKLTTEFNCCNAGMPRSMKNLKMKYENLKKQTKKKFAYEKQEMFKTGGGTATPVSVTSTDIKIREMLGVSIHGLNSVFDSDSTASEKITPATNKLPVEAEVIKILETEDTNTDTLNIIDEELATNGSNEELCASNVINSEWSSWNPKKLKTPMAKELNRPKPQKKDLTADCRFAINEVQKAKLELIRLQQEEVRQNIELRRQEHELNIQMKKEEHELKLQEMRKRIKLLDNK